MEVVGSETKERNWKKLNEKGKGGNGVRWEGKENKTGSKVKRRRNSGRISI